MRAYIFELEKHLGEAHRQASRLVRHQEELAVAIQEFGTAMVTLGRFEEAVSEWRPGLVGLGRPLLLPLRCGRHAVIGKRGGGHAMLAWLQRQRLVCALAALSSRAGSAGRRGRHVQPAGGEGGLHLARAARDLG